MKAQAYTDRFAPRDLYDLAGLADIDGFDAEAEAIYRSNSGHGFVANELTRLPKAVLASWDQELGRQVARPRSPAECSAAVVAALARLRAG